MFHVKAGRLNVINTVILIELEGYAMNGFTFNLTYNLLGFID